MSISAYKTAAYRKGFDETKFMSFLIKDNELLKKCNEILDEFSYATGKEFRRNSVYKKNI